MMWGFGAPATEADALELAALEEELISKKGDAGLITPNHSESSFVAASLSPSAEVSAGLVELAAASPAAGLASSGGDGWLVAARQAAEAEVGQRRRNNSRVAQGGLCARVGFACRAVATQVLTSPPVVGVVVGALIGLLTPVSDTLFLSSGLFRPIGSVIETFGAAMVPVSNLVLAGSLYHGSIDTIKRLSAGAIPGELWCRWAVARWCCPCCSACLCGRAAAGARGSAPALGPGNGGGMQTDGTDTTAGGGGVRAAGAIGHGDDELKSSPVAAGAPVCSVGAAATSETEPKIVAPSMYDEQLSWAAIVAIIALRLVFAPAASFGLFALAQWARIPLLVPPGGSMNSPEAAASSADALIWVIALLQSCTPSAQFALVVTQKAGLSKAAEALSLLYLLMYPLSLLTMPCWIILALSMVFGT